MLCNSPSCPGTSSIDLRVLGLKECNTTFYNALGRDLKETAALATIPLRFFHSANAQLQGEALLSTKISPGKRNVKGPHRCAISNTTWEEGRTCQSFNKLEGRSSQGSERMHELTLNLSWTTQQQQILGGTSTVKLVPEILHIFKCNCGLHFFFETGFLCVGYILNQFFSPKNTMYDDICYNLSRW